MNRRMLSIGCFIFIVVSFLLPEHKKISESLWIIGTVTWWIIFFYDDYKLNKLEKENAKEENFLYDGFLICSVRDTDKEERQEQQDCVDYLEKELGLKIYWPYRDTNQDDPIGDRINADNLVAIKASRRVFVWWNPESYGSHYDLGEAMALGKQIVPLNMHKIKRTEKKSYTNVLHRISDELARKKQDWKRSRPNC